jgi:hypothetical protein
LEVIEVSSARDVFKQHLKEERQAQADIHSPQTVGDFVRICLPYIRKAIKQKTSWGIIAKAIQAVAKETYSTEIRIAPSTAKRAYYRITGKASKQTSASVPATATTTQPAPTTATVATPAPAPEPVARSPAAEPEPEPTSKVVNTPAVPEATIPSLQDRLRNTRNPRTPRGYENCKTK